MTTEQQATLKKFVQDKLRVRLTRSLSENKAAVPDEVKALKTEAPSSSSSSAKAPKATLSDKEVTLVAEPEDETLVKTDKSAEEKVRELLAKKRRKSEAKTKEKGKKRKHKSADSDNEAEEDDGDGDEKKPKKASNPLARIFKLVNTKDRRPILREKEKLLDACNHDLVKFVKQHENVASLFKAWGRDVSVDLGQIFRKAMASPKITTPQRLALCDLLQEGKVKIDTVDSDSDNEEEENKKKKKKKTKDDEDDKPSKKKKKKAKDEDEDEEEDKPAKKKKKAKQEDEDSDSDKPSKKKKKKAKDEEENEEEDKPTKKKDEEDEKPVKKEKATKEEDKPAKKDEAPEKPKPKSEDKPPAPVKASASASSCPASDDKGRDMLKAAF
jgi:hypothetical protein